MLLSYKIYRCFQTVFLSSECADLHCRLTDIFPASDELMNEWLQSSGIPAMCWCSLASMIATTFRYCQYKSLFGLETDLFPLFYF